MKPNISILSPTRNRPVFVSQMMKSCISTASYPDKIEFVFYLDSDDLKSEDSIRSTAYKLNIENNIVIVRGERIVLSQMWNVCWQNSNADIFMHGSDDIRFRTQGWDEIVLNEFEQYPDKIILLHGEDGYAPKDFGTHSFVHKNWTNTVGTFVPEYFSSDYNDTWLNDVADIIGRNKRIEIYTEHLHPVVGKYFWDQNHKDRRARGERDNVKEIYESKSEEREIFAKKLKKFIDDYGENK
ncbi:MAG: hypothetical protein VX737_00475 [Pseudomonadota bacterium]|nr:hypothetical protein [Pseudomonadota bacterium]